MEEEKILNLELGSKEVTWKALSTLFTEFAVDLQVWWWHTRLTHQTMRFRNPLMRIPWYLSSGPPIDGHMKGLETLGYFLCHHGMKLKSLSSNITLRGIRISSSIFSSKCTVFIQNLPYFSRIFSLNDTDLTAIKEFLITNSISSKQCKSIPRKDSEKSKSPLSTIGLSRPARRARCLALELGIHLNWELVSASPSNNHDNWPEQLMSHLARLAGQIMPLLW